MWNEAKNFKNTPRKRFVLYILIDFFAQLDKPLELARLTEILAELYEEAHPNTPAGHMPIKDIFYKRANPANIPRLKCAIKISDSINSFAYNSIALADTYVKMNQAEKDIEYLESVERKLHTVNKPQILLDIYSKLSSISIEASNFKDAQL